MLILAIAFIVSSAHAQLADGELVLSGVSVFNGSNTYNGFDASLGTLKASMLTGSLEGSGVIQTEVLGTLIEFQPLLGFSSGSLNLSSLTVIYGNSSVDLLASQGELSGSLDLASANSFILGSSVFSSLNLTGSFIDFGSLFPTLTISCFSSDFNLASGVLFFAESGSVIPEPASSGFLVAIISGNSVICIRRKRC